MIYLYKELLVIISPNVEARDVVEQLVRSHGVLHSSSSKEIGGICAISEQKLQSVGVRRFHRLADIDEVYSPSVPQHVVLTEVCMNQVAGGVHLLHTLGKRQSSKQMVHPADLHHFSKLNFCYITKIFNVR